MVLSTLLAALLAVSGGAIAFADSLVADGDTLVTGDNVTLSGTPCGARSFGGNLRIAWNNQNKTSSGLRHYSAGEALSVVSSISPSSSGITSAKTNAADPTIPATWGVGKKVKLNIPTTNVPAGTANGNYTVGYTAGRSSNYSLSGSFTVSVNCTATATNRAPAVAADEATVQADEGTPATTSGTWSDATRPTP